MKKKIAVNNDKNDCITMTDASIVHLSERHFLASEQRSLAV